MKNVDANLQEPLVFLTIIPIQPRVILFYVSIISLLGALCVPLNYGPLESPSPFGAPVCMYS